MAILNNVLFKTASGIIEKQYIIYVRCGQINIRTKPLSVYNPKTEKQQINRAKHKLLNQIYAQINPLLNAINLERNKKHSGYNAIQTINSPTNIPDSTLPYNGSLNEYIDNIQLTPESFQFSKGTLLPPEIIDISCPANGQITVQYAGNPNMLIHNENDYLVILALTRDTHKALVSASLIATRGYSKNPNTYTFNMPGFHSDYFQDSIFYLCFTNNETKKSSDSVTWQWNPPELPDN